MKVLHINCNYLVTPLHQEMMNHLAEKGTLGDVFVPTHDASTALIKLNPNVIVTECFGKYDYIFHPIKWAKVNRAVKKHINPSDYDVTHAYTLFSDGGPAEYLYKKYGIPYVTAVRFTDVYGFFRMLPWTRKHGISIMKHASYIFFLSENYRELVFSKYVPARLKNELYAKTRIIPNGIDDFWLDHQFTNTRVDSIERIRRRELRIVYTGRMIERKNIEGSLQAIKLLIERGWNVRYTVAGSDDDKAIKEKVLSEPFTIYYPKKPKEELLDIYRENDIFLMPSHKETFGLSYPEAMSQGLPVIYTKGQGFDGQLPDGVAGYPVNNLAPEDIANKIELAAARYEELSQNCVKHSEDFRWSDICSKYIQLYESMKGTAE